MLVSRVVLFIMLCKQILTFLSVNKIFVLTIQVRGLRTAIPWGIENYVFNSDPNFKRRNLTEWSLKYEQFASVSVSEQLHNHPSPNQH